VRQKCGGVERAWIVRLEGKHGRYGPVELRPQQIVFGGIVGIEGGASDACFFCNVADVDVAVSAAVKKIDECGVELPARANGSPVLLKLGPIFAVVFAVIRDTCGFVFGKCHLSTFSVVRRCEPL